MPAGQQYPNPLGDRTEIGEVYRDSNAEVIVDARTEGRPLRSLRFPEAGLRAQLVYPRTGELKVGILVSGGIAPGVNAVISSIVDRHCLYARRSEAKGNAYALDVLGYVEGFRALLGQGAGFRRLNHGGEPDEFVRSRAERGGSMLPTSRASELLNRDLVKRADDLETVVRALTRHDGIDILYVIAGDGGMKAAHAIWTMAQNERNPVSVVAIPKTMDNDILWVWQSFGFLSAVEKAKEAILQLHTEATSNPRVCVIQLFGSDSGFVCSHAALASGVCDAILIPEVEFTMNGLSAYIQRRLRQRYHRKHPERHQPYAMILMAETAIPMDVEKYLDDGAVGLDEGERNAVRDYLENHRRVQGQTPDALRSAGLKVVTRILERDIRAMGEDYWRDFRVFSNEPRHLLRAIPPSVSDVVIGHRLGALAVDNAMAGYTDFMISQWLTEYVLVPLKLVVLGRKRVPRSGFFWNSVVANTGQPAFSPDGA
jgi:6-phosphofructokinase 1